MRKLIFGMGMLLLGASTFVACEDDKIVEPTALPTNANTFIAANFPDATIVRVEQDNQGYSVDLSNRIDVEFNNAGEWVEVDGEDAVAIPVGFIPKVIVDYISLNYANIQINGIEKNNQGYEVDLLTVDTDLIFDQEGIFVRVDP